MEGVQRHGGRESEKEIVCICACVAKKASQRDERRDGRGCGKTDLADGTVSYADRFDRLHLGVYRADGNVSVRRILT